VLKKKKNSEYKQILFKGIAAVGALLPNKQSISLTIKFQMFRLGTK